MQRITLQATAVQSFCHYKRYILIVEQWYQLPEFISSSLNSGLHSCINISIHTQRVT